MKLSIPINFIAVLSSAVDSGKYQHITVNEVRFHIENGDLIPYLINELGDAANLLTIYSPDDVYALNQTLLDVTLVYYNRERRKFGIENSGLCLLITYANEIVCQNIDTGKLVNVPELR